VHPSRSPKFAHPGVHERVPRLPSLPRRKPSFVPDFIGGYRQQEPIIEAQLHLVRRFTPGFWASLDLNYFEGGRQTIDGRELIDLQQNSRIGGTLVVPFKGRHALKLGYATGIFTEFGTDFDQYLMSYQVLLR